MFKLKGFGDMVSKTKAILRSSLSVVLVLCLVAVMLPTGLLAVSADDSTTGYWHEVAATSFAGGGGTPENPYLISTAAQLAYLYNRSQTQNDNVYFKLTQDIDLAGKYWAPIGPNTSKRFGGHLDGDGYTIRNMTVNTTEQYAGFVGVTKVNASFTNLHIQGTVTQNYTAGTGYAGGIVGYAHTKDGSVFTPLPMTGCSFTGTVESQGNTANRVGGLIGNVYGYATLRNCFTAGEVKGPGSVGGLCGGASYLTVTNCYSTVTVTFTGTVPANGNPAIGGVAGTVSGGTTERLTVTNFYFAGSVERYPITMYQVGVDAFDNMFYRQDSVLTNYGSVTNLGATAFTDATVNDVCDSLNQKVEALRTAGTEGLNYWSVQSGVLTFADLPKLSGLSLSRGTFVFDAATLSYTVSVSNSASDLKVTPTAADDITITVNGTAVNSGEAFTVPLTPDTEATVTVVVGRNGVSQTQTYTVNVTRTNVWDGAVADGYAGGDGTQGDPYQIATPEQLAYLAQQTNNGVTTRNVYFKLTADIDLGGTVKWTTIGKNSPTFSGYFDGNGHKIEGLYVKDPGNDAGLFGRTSYGWIKNLTVYGDVSNSSGYCGGIVGRLGGGTSMTNCAFIGTVSGSLAVGGLAGSTNPYSGSGADFAITNCWTAGTVTGTNSSATAPAVGGLLGYGVCTSTSVSSVTFTNCFSTMTVITSSTKSAPELVGVGGLCGDNSSSNGAAYTFDNCYFGGTVNSPYPIAKPANSASVVSATSVFYKNDSYVGTAAGVGVDDGKGTEVLDSDVTGGSLGEQLNARVRTLKASGVSGISNWIFEADGTPAFAEMPQLTGLSLSCGEITFDASTLSYMAAVPSTVTSTTVTATADDGVTITVNGETVTSGLAKTVALTGNGDVVISVVAERDTLEETYSITVRRPTAVPGVEPWDGTTVATAFAGGTGTQDDPYQIANAEQLAYLASQLANGGSYSADTYFELVSDIDLGNHNWEPIGNLYRIDAGNKYYPFSSVFNGGNHTVYNLYCGTTLDHDYETAGLFGYAKGATIKNLHVEGLVTNTRTDEGWALAAGLVGRAEQSVTIENCSFAGDILGSMRAGGLIGLVYQGEITISGSWTEGSVKGSSTTGGMIGHIAGKSLTVSNSYSVMNVIGSKTATGGFLGTINVSGAPETVFANCHFAGSVAQNPIVPQDLDSTTLTDVYYKADSVTETPAGELDGAVAKEAPDFAGGTVTALLNRVLIGATTWKDGENGYPVTVTLPDRDALTGLLVNDALFDFNPSTFAYKVTVPYTADKAYFAPTAVQGAVVTVNGKTVERGALSEETALEVGVPTKFDIHVTVDGATRAYAVTVTRREQAPAGAWDGSLEAYVTEDRGATIGNPICIENEGQLAFLSAMVNGYSLLLDGKVYKAPERTADGKVYKDVYFQIKSDLKLNVLDDIENWETNAPYNNWEPIGVGNSKDAEAKMFAGTIDGDHHTISGLYSNVNRLTTEGVGLFGATCNATIRNIHIEDSCIIASQRTGGIVGFARRNLTLQNCSFSGTIKLSATQSTQYSYGGGLVGSITTAKLVMNSCWSEGKLYGAQYTGGLLGYTILLSNSSVVNCYSSMEIITPTDTSNVGGLIGGVGSLSVGGLEIRRSHFAGYINTPNGSPIYGALETFNPTYSMENVYYRAGSYVGQPDETLLMDAEEKTVEEFRDGMVTELLNAEPDSSVFWNWEDGENGYPVSDGIILITKYEYALNDSQFDDGNWADQFVNKEGGELIGVGNSGAVSDSDNTPNTGESTVYVAVIVLLLISAASVFLFARRKRNAD